MEIVVPELGEVGEARLVRWLKQAGEGVHAGEAVAEVEADKAVFVIEAPVAGVLDQVLTAEGEEVRAGQVLARLRSHEAS